MGGVSLLLPWRSGARARERGGREAPATNHMHKGTWHSVLVSLATQYRVIITSFFLLSLMTNMSCFPAFNSIQSLRTSRHHLETKAGKWKWSNNPRVGSCDSFLRMGIKAARNKGEDNGFLLNGPEFVSCYSPGVTCWLSLPSSIAGGGHYPAG